VKRVQSIQLDDKEAIVSNNKKLRSHYEKILKGIQNEEDGSDRGDHLLSLRRKETHIR